MTSTPATTPPPTRSTRAAPPLLCLRRRCRACRDIPGTSRLPRGNVISCQHIAAASTLGADTMNPDTAELAIVETASEPAVALRSFDSDQVIAARDSWRALWSSRLLVWLAAVGTLLAFGPGPVRTAFNPVGLTRGLGWLGNLLAAPAARWDAAWYMVIARYGYRPDLGPFTSPRTAFFPLYPLGLRAIATVGAPLVIAGVLLSLLALALALYGIHRLTTLELARGGLAAIGAGGGDIARLAVVLTAFAPMAFFFSAVYSESLYLALSVGLFWSARQGRWALVGVLGGLAAATRSTGLVLALPAAILYLYGPREDRPADFAAAGRWRRRAAGGGWAQPTAAIALLGRLRPR